METAHDEPGVYELGAWTFDAATGDLTRTGDASAVVTRLAPKPSRLLHLLIEKDGELLTQDEIRRALWDDVQVEFDQGVHYCVRQIRAALGESAAQAVYIETLPRRGYRLLIPATRVDHPVNSPRRRDRRRTIAVVSVIAVVAAAGLLLSRSLAAPGPVRIAIMPFGPDDGTGQIATHLLALLGDDASFAVVGPSTTSIFSDGDTPLADASAALDVNYIVNARFADRDGRPQMLAELIRTSDGAHVWVQWYDELNRTDQISASIAQGVRRTLD